MKFGRSRPVSLAAPASSSWDLTRHSADLLTEEHEHAAHTVGRLSRQVVPYPLSPLVTRTPHTPQGSEKLAGASRSKM